jgi:hypothetical protein
MWDFSVSKNIIVSQMAIVSICWLKLLKFNSTYNVRNVKFTVLKLGPEVFTFFIANLTLDVRYFEAGTLLLVQSAECVSTTVQQ